MVETCPNHVLQKKFVVFIHSVQEEEPKNFNHSIHGRNRGVLLAIEAEMLRIEKKALYPSTNHMYMGDAARLRESLFRFGKPLLKAVFEIFLLYDEKIEKLNKK